MNPLNSLMNRVDGWCQPTNDKNEAQSVWVRYPLTMVSPIVLAPTEVAATAENALYLLGQGIAFGPQFLVNVFSFISGSDCCDVVTGGKSTIELFSDILKTVYKVAAYAIGTVFTSTLGFISPSANLAVQAWAGNFDNKGEIARAKLAAQKLKETLEVEATKTMKNIGAKIAEDEAAAKAELEKLEVAKKAEQDKQALEAAAKATQESEAAKKASEENLAVAAAKDAEAEGLIEKVVSDVVNGDTTAASIVDESTINEDIEGPKKSKWNPLNWNLRFWRKAPQQVQV